MLLRDCVTKRCKLGRFVGWLTDSRGKKGGELLLSYNDAMEFDRKGYAKSD